MSSTNYWKIKGFIYYVMFAVLMKCVIVSNSAYAHLLNDYPEASEPEAEMIQEPSGAFIKLKCELNSCNIKQRNNIFKWEYKTCDRDAADKSKCVENKTSEWINLQGYRITDHCTSVVTIKKAVGNNSGFYRCSIKQQNSEQFKIVKIYQIYVIEPYHVRNGSKPKLLDIEPLNITIIENLKIVVQCRVYSDFIIPPEIWWLKYIDSTESYKSPSIHDAQNNKTYLKLKSSQMALANNTYVSKLIIEKSSENDTGAYTCVAVNFYGKSNKDIYIDVIVSQKDWEGTTSFTILFLIPLGFALIPISGWLFVYYYRKKKLRTLQLETEMRSEIYKYKLILNNFNQSRTVTLINQRTV